MITTLIHSHLPYFKKNLEETREKLYLAQKAREDDDVQKQTLLNKDISRTYYQFSCCFCLQKLFPAFNYFSDDTESLEINEEKPYANNSSVRIVRDDYDDSNDPDNGHSFEQKIYDNPNIFEKTGSSRHCPTSYICATGCKKPFVKRIDLLTHLLNKDNACTISDDQLKVAQEQFNKNTKSYQKQTASYRKKPYDRSSSHTD